MSGGDAEQLLRSMMIVNRVERLIESLTDVYEALQSFTARPKLHRCVAVPGHAQGEIGRMAPL
jgi:hypothetical protein